MVVCYIHIVHIYVYITYTCSLSVVVYHIYMWSSCSCEVRACDIHHFPGTNSVSHVIVVVSAEPLEELRVEQLGQRVAVVRRLLRGCGYN